MREATVARVYAQTFLEVARERGAVDRIAGEVEVLREAFRATPRLSRFLESPRIGADEKKAALRKALEGSISGETLHFLEVVVERERQELLEEILEQFGDLIEGLRNQEVLEVTSAVPLSEPLRERLRESFGRATGRRILLEERVDPRLMGGVVVQLGDKRIDGSLRTRLENLRERMLRAGAAHADAGAA